MRDAFDRLMRNIDPVMVIVTTIAGEERSGCLVGFHSQSSIDPPRHVVWISRANHTFEVAERASTFAVHTIPPERYDLAELFGGTTGDEVDKLAQCEWVAGPDGVPLLDGCPDRFVGRRVDWIDGDGDHCGVVLEIVEAAADAGPYVHLQDVLDLDPGHEADD